MPLCPVLLTGSSNSCCLLDVFQTKLNDDDDDDDDDDGMENEHT